MEPEQPYELKEINDLKPNAKNPRRISEHDFKALMESIKKFGDLSCVIFNVRTQQLVGGHQRIEAIKRLNPPAKIMVEERKTTPDQYGTVATGKIYYNGEDYKYREVDWDEGTEKAANIAANRIQGEFDMDMLAQMDYELSLLDNGAELLALSGQEEGEIARLLQSVSGSDNDEDRSGNLSAKFIVPPFSVLDTKQGYWQSRRTAWLDIGIKSELGRNEGLLGSSDNLVGSINDGTSVFDPVLCELIYRWFNVPEGVVLDTFAGGSVRGVVASKLGQKYIGVELRGEQVEANRIQGELLCEDNKPVWVEGDSTNVGELTENIAADLFFSCPPYADLEVYSDNPADISNMVYDDFLTIYSDIIAKGCKQLKNDRFAVFVIGEVRGKDGNYYNFVGDTITAFKNAGLHYYNEMILVNSAGTLPMRAGKQFNAGRKIGKQHQNVLVFYKGDTKNISTNFPVLDFSELENMFIENVEKKDLQ